MDNIPFGIARLDMTIGGGSPPGHVVLLAGEAGAGSREFGYTSAAMNALGRVDEELFDLYYGEVSENASLPSEVHYLSFTSGGQYVEREMRYAMDDDIVDAVTDEIHFRDFSPEYFQLSPIPREWYLGETTRITDLGKDQGRGDVLSTLGDYLNEHAEGNLVVIDSVTDLVGSISEDMDWGDVAMLVKGISKAAYQWGGLILLLLNRTTLEPTEYGQLMDAVTGTFEFSWESGGSQRARTMVVQEFRGVLSQLEEENIVRFETEIHEGGFDISDVRKIR